ncbi:MAG: SapC family protein [Gammaproteobacteria bacterium SHHR-1]
MANYSVISKEQHADKGWRRYSSYAFAAGDNLAPLVMQELPRAALTLPIGFIQVEEHFVPVAVQGLAQGKNLFVAADGRWLAGYIPAAYRAYPFKLARTETDQQVLCIDEDSGLICAQGEGEAFFDTESKASQAVSDVLNFISQVEANRQATQTLCDRLAEQGLFQPWPIKIKLAEGERDIGGLFRIDEARLNNLEPEQFEAVRQAGGLPLIYCQLLSMQHLAILGKLAEAHAKASQPLPQTAQGELDLEFLNQSDTINFSGL